MFTIIGGDGKEYGPVTVEQLRGWIAAGRANLDTKAKQAGSEDWHPLSEFAEFSPQAAAALPPALPRPQPTRLDGPVDLRTFAAELISRARPLDIFSCLERSFTLWKTNFLSLVGVTLSVIVLQMAMGLVPVIGSIAGLFLNGVFYGGLYYYYLGKMRGEPRNAGDVFAGFSKAFVPLMVATLLTTFLCLALVLPAIGPWMLPIIKAAAAGTTPTFSFSDVGPLQVGGIIVAFVLMVYLSISWLFAFALIIDQGLGAWTAMEVSRRVVTKQWFRVFILAVLGGILAMLGIVGLFVGIILTLPLAFGALLYAYEDLCNPPRTDVVTPTPLTPDV